MNRTTRREVAAVATTMPLFIVCRHCGRQTVWAMIGNLGVELEELKAFQIATKGLYGPGVRCVVGGQCVLPDGLGEAYTRFKAHSCEESGRE